MVHARSQWLAAVLIAVALAGAVGASEPEYIIGGGGAGFGLSMPDLAEINEFVDGAGFAPFGDRMMLIGGGGRGGFVPGPMFGGAGWGAWIESRRGNFHAEYGVGLGGFDMGYGIGGTERSVLTIGAVVGGGGAEVVLTEDPVPTNQGIGSRGVVVEPTRQVYDSAFAFVAPYLDVQIQLLDWMGFAVRAGYVLPLFELNGQDQGPLYAPALALAGPYVRVSVVFGAITAVDAEI